MGLSNHGSQDITYNYHEEATAEDFNKRHLDIRSRGIYSGGYFTRVSDSEVTLSPFTLEIGDDDEQISSKSSVAATLNSTTLDSGTISSATPWIVFRWAFAELVANFVEIHAIASVAVAQDNDIIIGKCVFDGATLDSFIYTDRSFLNVQDISLRVEVCETGGMYVWVRAGRIQNSSGYALAPEQRVGLFTVPSSPNSRIDLVYIDSTGAIAIEQGVAAPSPSAPDYGGKLVLGEIRLVNGDTSIIASRIIDTRSFISAPITVTNSIFGTWTDKDSLSNTLVKAVVYKVGSDGYIVAYTLTKDATISGYTDANADPTGSKICYAGYHDAGYNTITMPVKKDQYCKITSDGTVVIRWLPIGSGTCVKQ